MGELPTQLLAWLAKLLPQQKVQGDNAVQVGKVQGGLHTDRSTHSSAVHVVQHVTHQHFYAGAQAPMPAPDAAPPTTNEAAPLTHEQRAVFMRMKRLPQRTYNKVVAFMRDELGTGVVGQLHGAQLHRLRCYVEAIERNAQRERA